MFGRLFTSRSRSFLNHQTKHCSLTDSKGKTTHTSTQPKYDFVSLLTALLLLLLLFVFGFFFIIWICFFSLSGCVCFVRGFGLCVSIDAFRLIYYFVQAFVSRCAVFFHSNSLDILIKKTTFNKICSEHVKRMKLLWKFIWCNTVNEIIRLRFIYRFLSNLLKITQINWPRDNCCFAFGRLKWIKRCWMVYAFVVVTKK